VANPDEIADVINVADEEGGVDIMVNNAAIVQEVDMDVDEETYDRIMDVNTKGVFFGTRLAANQMADSDGGSIINIASPEGYNAVAQRPVYSASRAAVPIISNACAGYFGPENVRVNTIHPGLVRTRMVIEDTRHIPEGENREQEYIEATPLRKIGEPKEIGDVVVFLASDLSSNITAEEIVVDCGASNISSTSISRQEHR
jgi:NAD(P)-dependent dehydrogenase (short-subunit alcohol dehydrogenase family)